MPPENGIPAERICFGGGGTGAVPIDFLKGTVLASRVTCLIFNGALLTSSYAR